VIVARGACDDKGQVMTFVEACRAWRAVTGSLPVGLTLLVEGAEEDGSKFLPEWVEANRAELQADLALVCDTGMWDGDTPAITASLRGLVYEEVIVRAADRDLHSGLFGGAAQNPVRVLARIIADLHDETGRITLPASTTACARRLPRSWSSGRASTSRRRNSSARSASRNPPARRAACSSSRSSPAPPAT
jgi:acetylornithine deacetylase/succinyl-diaminopimelate desuccinylase-like protein